MAGSLSVKVGIGLVATDSRDDELSRLTDYLSLVRGKTFAEGEGADQCDMFFHDQRPLADGASETPDLDFHNGSLVNKVGIPITMDILKAIYIKNNAKPVAVDPDDGASLEVGGAASNALGLFKASTAIIVIPPGGEFVFICPDAVGIDITTNSKLKIAHNGTGSKDITYDIIVAGVDVA